MKEDYILKSKLPIKESLVNYFIIYDLVIYFEF